ncbi:MAG: hydroxyacid dehydrogenase, partial [Candidatus Omnitrophica bacterium]|nr:hydroxyacid dehydrogenase [Candidatus Omnitrophota bacterium]
GLLLEGKRLGLIGFGRIGQRVATLAAALGIIVRYYDPFAEVSGKDQRQTHSLRELLSQSDIVSIHVPLSSETRALMGAEQFKAMNKGAYLIQCSRGGVIDEEGLYEALDSGHLAGAALDVFETEPYSGPLKNLDNVILLPHIGSYAQETRMRMEMEAVNNLIHQWHLLRS